MTQTKTTPISGYTAAQVTPALVEQARKIAAGRGDKQFGFRASKTEPFHTVIVTAGGTLQNPNGSAGDMESADEDMSAPDGQA